MKSARALWLLGLSIACSGCALVEDAGRNFCVAVSTPAEVHREKARNEKWAEASWQMTCMKDGPGTHSVDFARGFKDGFAEYLFRGGDCEPPIVAPLHYRHARYQTPQGYQAIQDWFEGYRLGATTARDSGARRWIVGPSSLQSDQSALPMRDSPPDMAPHFSPLQQESTPLPQPQQVPAQSDAPPPLPLTKLEANLPEITLPAKVEQERPFFMPPLGVALPAERNADAVKLKIINIREAPVTEAEAPRIKIVGTRESAVTAPETSNDPRIRPSSVRARIQSIKTAPQEDR